MELIFLLMVNWLLCYILTTSTTNMMSTADIIYGLSWYELPRDQQFIERIGCVSLFIVNVLEGN